MANQMKMMREELKEITDNHQSFTLRTDINTIHLNLIDIRETSSTMEDKEHIIGRMDEKEKILFCLSENMTKDFSVLPIYGIGGLGKTTLAKLVFNNSQFREYSQVWIYVSQAFDLKKIGNSILSQLLKKKIQYTEMQMIHSSLREFLANKKILIVLDDLWEGNKSHLDKLMDMLKVGESGKVVVIVTTRSKGIAEKIATIQSHKLASLTDDMCWTIIKQKSEFELRDDQQELEQIGKDIANKCAGVALAAQSLGHMLNSLTFDEWESMRNSDIWNVSSSDVYSLEDTASTYVIASLRLSYSVMPSNLKLCFAYCAIFPKGYKIAKDDLIQQWICLGFIKEINMLSARQLGEKYIRQLVGLSFLEHLESALITGVNFGNDTLFTMHDLVHDLARSVMVGEILVSSKHVNAGGSCCHFALLNDCRKPLESTKIRALRFMECGETKLNGAAFSSSKSMRVLDLSECSIQKLPDSIGILKQLKYLSAPRIQDATIPSSITRLSKLIYLNLQGSSRIKALPESIGEIVGLEYVDLSGCSRIRKLPESFRMLKDLVHLDLSNCSHVRDISVFLGSLTRLQYLNLSYCRNIGEIPEALGGLSKLQYLNLSFSSFLEFRQEVDVLGALTKLEYLNLSSEHCDIIKLPEALGIFIQLKYLNLSGCWELRELPRLFGRLKNLVHLDLSHCYTVDHLDEALIGLNNLQYLNLVCTRRLSSLPDGLTKLRYLNLSRLRDMPKDTFKCLINHISSNLSDLEHLDLSGNPYISNLPESIGNLRKLHTLDLSDCESLKKIPESIGTIESLKFLYLKRCDGISELPQLASSAISLPHFVVQPANGDSGSNLVQLEHMDPDVLQITRLEIVKSPQEAYHIKLMEKKNMEILKLEWTGDVERFVDDKLLLENLVPPSTLWRLEICGYSGISFPAWVVGQLPKLTILILRGMSNLEEWNTSYSSGEQLVLRRLEIHDCPMLRMKPHLPKVNSWVISNSDNVFSSWDDCTVPHTNSCSSSYKVFMLKVRCCKVPLQQWRMLQHFSGITYLCINKCSDLTGSPEIIRQITSLKKLCLKDIDLEEMPKWMDELTSLKRLKICGGRVLKGSNENMRQLKKLKSLNLQYCDTITSLPHWLGELTSLKILIISACDVLRSLPQSIQQLTSLVVLKINSCPELKHIVQLEEGKMDPTDNQERLCVLPTSLTQLTIHKCDGIKSLPQGIQQLTNLRKLRISWCTELKQWCELEENKMKLDHIAVKEFTESGSYSE